MGRFMYTDIATSAGPFRIIVIIIRRWLWADSCTPTLLLRRAHSGLSSLLFGGGCGPIHVHRHYCFGGPIQDYRHYYLVVAVGPFRYIDITALAGPFRIIVIIIRWWLWAHSGISTLLLRRAHLGLSSLLFGGGCGPIHVHRHYCLGGPIQDYRHNHSAVVVGPFKSINVSIPRWLWAHPILSTPLVW